MTLKQAGRVPFVFAEVLTFTGDKISRLETFHINLDGPVAVPVSHGTSGASPPAPKSGSG